MKGSVECSEVMSWIQPQVGSEPQNQVIRSQEHSLLGHVHASAKYQITDYWLQDQNFVG